MLAEVFCSTLREYTCLENCTVSNVCMANSARSRKRNRNISGKVGVFTDFGLKYSFSSIAVLTKDTELYMDKTVFVQYNDEADISIVC